MTTPNRASIRTQVFTLSSTRETMKREWLKILTVAFLLLVVAPWIMSVAIGQNPVKRAVIMNRLADDWKQKVDKQFAELVEGIDRVDLPAVEREAVAADQLLDIIPELRTPALWVIDNYPAYEDAAAALEAALRKAAVANIAAAERHQELAAAADDRRIVEQYEFMAAESEALAGERSQEAESLDGERRRVRENVEFVRKSMIVLDEMQQFLQLYPTVERIKVTEYRQQLDDYVDGFEQALQAFRALRTIRKQANPTQNSAASQTP